MVGQPQTSAQNLSAPITSNIPSSDVNGTVYRAPRIDSGMGTSNPSTPSTPSSTPTTATTSSISIQDAKESAGVWDLFEKEINAFTAESEEKEKQAGKGPALQILKPDQLNERHTPGKDPPPMERPEGAAGLQQFTMSTPGGGSKTVIVQKLPGVQGMVTPSPTKIITVQNPLGAQAPSQGAIRLQSPAALGLPIAGSNTVTGAPRIIVSSAPGQYLYPLGNRRQTGAIATTMIRLATTVSSPLNTMAPQMVAGTSGLGVRLASPASLLAPVPNPAIMMSPQPRLATPPPGMASPVRPGQPGAAVPGTPGTPVRAATPGSPMRAATPGSPMRGRGGPRPRGMVRMRGGPPGMRPPC